MEPTTLAEYDALRTFHTLEERQVIERSTHTRMSVQMAALVRQPLLGEFHYLSKLFQPLFLGSE